VKIENSPSTGSFDALKASLDTFQEVTPVVQKVYVREVDSLGRSYATGKRKDSVARVWIKPGRGTITVNGRTFESYFARPVLRMIINQPFFTSKTEGQYDVICTVAGGGLSGQAGALRHGISQALVRQAPDLRTPLKAGGFMTRDSRTVERKKYGQHGARRGCQFSKR
jgi:small subunit ribosomal protein S9